MEKQNKFPLAMNNMGVPKEMSPINNTADKESKEPIVEVDRPIDTKDPLEIGGPGSVTVI